MAERLTIRASNGVLSGGAYIRLFIEPKVRGLRYQGRYAEFVHHLKGAAGLDRGIGFAYAGLTVAFVLAWLAGPVQGSRLWWQTMTVLALGAFSLWQVSQLLRRAGATRVVEAWKRVWDSEQHQRKDDPSAT